MLAYPPQIYLFFVLFFWIGPKLSPLDTSAIIIWVIVPAPDDRWWVWSSRKSKNWKGEPKYWEKACPSTTLSTTNPTWPDLWSDPVQHGEKPATDRLNYGTAAFPLYLEFSWNHNSTHNNNKNVPRDRDGAVTNSYLWHRSIYIMFSIQMFQIYIATWKPFIIGMTTGYVLNDRESIPGRSKIFLFSTTSRLALGPIQPSVQWVAVALSPGVKQQVREAVHSPPSIVEIKNSGAVPPVPSTSLRRDA
jgi:hypothetical protein